MNLIRRCWDALDSIIPKRNVYPSKKKEKMKYPKVDIKQTHDECPLSNTTIDTYSFVTNGLI